MPKIWNEDDVTLDNLAEHLTDAGVVPSRQEAARIVLHTASGWVTSSSWMSRRSLFALPLICRWQRTPLKNSWGVSHLDQESRRFYTHHKNACAYRIYAKVCIGREGRKPYCGTSGINPGKTWVWGVSRSTGHYRVMVSGVATGKDDYICPKPAGWKELGDADFDEVETTPGTSERESPVPASRDVARAWCMKKKNGEFWCNGPLQNGGWGKTLKAALNMVGCPDGSGYTPTSGTGGQSFSCGRELKSYEQKMPLYDPFYNREKPLQ